MSSLENVLNKIAHNPGGTAPHIAGDMGVGVQCEAGFCVSQDTGERLGIHPSGQGVCGEGVPEIEEADIGQPSF